MVTRSIEHFEIVEAARVGWGKDIQISINDPDGGGFAVVYISVDEAKSFVKEIKKAIKEVEGK